MKKFHSGVVAGRPLLTQRPRFERKKNIYIYIYIYKK